MPALAMPTEPLIMPVDGFTLIEPGRPVAE
jgi:hypothetical protein